MDRRTFLKQSALAGLGAAALPAARAAGDLGDLVVPCDLLVQGGQVIDPASGLYAVRDVAVRGGVVVAVEQGIPERLAQRVVDARGCYVSPGFVDIHVHAFVGHASGLSVDAGENGAHHGVTTVVDAGTSGAADVAAFLEVAARSPVRMLGFVNISRPGMYVGEQDPNTFSVEAAAQAVSDHPETCVGIKSAHYWTSEPYDSAHLPWASVDAGLAAARECARPAMLDFCPRPAQGGWPARTYRQLLLEKMSPGDIHTHCYAHLSAYQFPVLDENGRVNDYILEAQASGRILDVGHGGGSFSWTNARPAVEQGYLANSISTDLHTGNIHGPVYSLPYVMSKFLALGVSLEDVVRRVTVNPADEIGRPDLGRLAPGATADLCVFEVASTHTRFLDASGEALSGDRLLEGIVTVYGGEVLHDRDGRVRDVQTGIGQSGEPAAPPQGFAEAVCYPNAFVGSTQVMVRLRQAGSTRVEVRNVLGQLVVTLAQAEMTAGDHELAWGGCDEGGRPVAPGVYCVVVRQAARVVTCRVVRAR